MLSSSDRSPPSSANCEPLHYLQWQVYDVFYSFYRWKIKLLFLFVHLLIQNSPLNHNCNAFNVFLPFIAVIMRGQSIIKQSENGQSCLTVLSPGSARVFNVSITFCRLHQSLSLSWCSQLRYCLAWDFSKSSGTSTTSNSPPNSSSHMLLFSLLYSILLVS